MPASLDELYHRGAFIERHIGPDEAQVAAMLGELGLASLEQLLDATVPSVIRRQTPLALGAPLPEEEALARLRELAAMNQDARSFIGLGYYPAVTPKVILRNVLENPGWYTAYTPYQAEISQGRLEVLLAFQQMVMDLCGMELANASLLDEATAAAEAMALASRVSRRENSRRFFVDRHCFPQTLDVLRTRAQRFGFELVVGERGEAAGHGVFGALLQYPDAEGRVEDLAPLIEALHGEGACVVVATDLLACALLKPPGEMGADVVVGSSQRFGVPLGYGGPHAAFLAARDEFRRAVPGRLIGVSRDARGRPAYRMALQTREQHIRREKANSNICTAQVLLANTAALYAIYHGPDGLRRIAARVHRLAGILAEGLASRGLAPRHSSCFDTLTLEVDEARRAAILARAHDARFNLRIDRPGSLGLSLDERTTPAEIEALWRVLLGGEAAGLSVAELDGNLRAGGGDYKLPEALRRRSSFLDHPVFNRHHSETEMLRYLKKLENRDISLTHSMIPLGSCTMKLNASAEMIPMTWPAFSEPHPFAPPDQTQGYRRMIAQLEAMLAEITGFDAVSMQPNSGAQGEYAGLLAIRRYLDARGEGERRVCLIPGSAHGTNPASAQMIGMEVVVVACDRRGNVDLADLRARLAEHGGRLAALMLTYPSTHGVFEEEVVDICRLVHEHGGQVYMDGANMNAMVGVARAADIGADVCHVNLHKTFCIPHGGGGPGMGPIGVKKHLAPFLPGHALVPLAGPAADNGAVSAAPWGSAGILPISWMYITMMGAPGLLRATAVAILNANYLATRLAPHFPVLYTGRGGRVAHECIVDLRPLKAATGVTEEDVAKRLMDYGFHAPTMSFPVAGTLMIEPTESEARGELDRFIAAMAGIRREIARVEAGEWTLEESPLRRAPHTLADLADDSWDRPYSREEAAFPQPWLKEAKVWPAVNRIDNVYGDRNLFCACPAVEVYGRGD